jgi:ribosomal protein L37AE/L43A
MDADRRYPMWRDFDIPDSIVNAIMRTNQQSLLGFLVNDRVFRQENKVSYQYECLRCGHTKQVTRQYEDYSSCEKCRSEAVHGTPHWKEYRGSVKAVNNMEAIRIISQMTVNQDRYFGVLEPKPVEVIWENGGFVAQFIGGERVLDASPTNAVAKAAILCPYLWDNNFNWRDGIKNDRGNDLHISHIIMQWAY